MKCIKFLVSLFLVLLIASSMVFAGTSYVGYCTTVGRFNGSGYTAYQNKAIAGANGSLYSSLVGADYVVDARMQEVNGNTKINGVWTRDVDDFTYYSLAGHYEFLQGDYVRVQFSNDWCTPVNVQVQGSWLSN